MLARFNLDFHLNWHKGVLGVVLDLVLDKTTVICRAALLMMGVLAWGSVLFEVTVSGVVTDVYDGDTLTVEVGTWPGSRGPEVSGREE